MNGDRGIVARVTSGGLAAWSLARRMAIVVWFASVVLGACGPTGSSGPASGDLRIVSVAPALTAILLDLGAGESLTGVTRNCTLPATLKARPDIIGDFSPIPERVMAARPSVVVMADYASQARERQGLVALGLPVETFALVTLADLDAAITRLGAIVGQPARATTLRGALEASRTELAACLPETTPRPRYVLVYGTEPGFIYTTGGGDHVSELLALAGADNALAGLGTTARVGLERVLEARPDVIIHIAPSDGFEDSAKAEAYWGRWTELPAVARHAVFVWPDDRLARNGSHLAEVARPLCALVKDAAARGDGDTPR